MSEVGVERLRPMADPLDEGGRRQICQRNARATTASPTAILLEGIVETAGSSMQRH